MNKKGMTLVEVLVALLVTAILLSAIYYVLGNVVKMSKQQEAYVEAQDSLRITMLLIEKDLRRSSQELEIKKVNGCYLIKDNAEVETFEYCVVDDSLLRNGVVIIDRVASLDIEMKDFYIDVSIKGNYMERELSHEKKIYLRSAK